MNIYFVMLYFFVYSFLGWCTEVAFAAFKEHRFVNRGFLNGPLCPIYGFGVSIVILLLTPYKNNLPLLFVTSIILVTLLEGLTGWCMEKIFHHKWWDYSQMPLNIGGYVCLLFSLIWGAFCVVILKLFHPLIQKPLELLPFPIGIIFIIMLSALLITDTCVTASSIFKLNQNLEKMEKIAKDLHEFSDRIGKDIYERTMHTMDTVEELNQRYRELEHKTEKITTRLFRAFPHIESRKHKKLFAELREHLTFSSRK